MVRRGGGTDGAWITKDIMMAFGTEGIAPVQAAIDAGQLRSRQALRAAIERFEFLERDASALSTLLGQLPDDDTRVDPS